MNNIDPILSRKTTTDLNVIRNNPRRFTWGQVAKIHDIGPYTIVEFVRHDSTEVCFHLYVDGKDECSSCSTLDGALVLAIARKHLEANEARFMAMAATKLLGIKE
jgi:hypothetical protein